MYIRVGRDPIVFNREGVVYQGTAAVFRNNEQYSLEDLKKHPQVIMDSTKAGNFVLIHLHGNLYAAAIFMPAQLNSFELLYDEADEDRFACMETVEELRLTEAQDSVSKIEEELDEGVVFLLIDQDDNALLLLSANAYYGVAFV